MEALEDVLLLAGREPRPAVADREPAGDRGDLDRRGCGRVRERILDERVEDPVGVLALIQAARSPSAVALSRWSRSDAAPLQRSAARSASSRS